MIEDCLLEVEAAITASLPALLDAEDTEYAAADVIEFGVALVLDDIAEVRFESHEEHLPQNLPQIYLLPTSTADNPMLTAETRLVHTVECVVLVADTDPAKLARRLFRTVEAFRRMLTANVEGTGVTSDPVFQTDIQRIDYSPTFEHETGGLARTAILTVDLHEWEGRP